MHNPLRSGRLIADKLIGRVIVACVVCMSIVLSTVFPLWIVSQRLRMQGNDYLAHVIAEMGPAIEFSPESVSKMTSDMDALSKRIGSMPIVPRCASQNAILFLAATRLGGASENTKSLVEEYRKAVDAYLKDVEELRRAGCEIDSIVAQIEASAEMISSRQFGAVQRMRDEIEAFKAVCRKRFIFKHSYASEWLRMSDAYEETRKLLAKSSAFVDLKALSLRHIEISKEVEDLIGRMGTSESASQSAAARLRDLPYDAWNAENMWASQFSAATNAVVARSRAFLRELDSTQKKCNSKLDVAQSVLKESIQEIELGIEKYPMCLDADDVQLLARYSNELDGLKGDQEFFYAACKKNLSEQDEKILQGMGRLDSEAVRIIHSVNCNDQDWVSLFDELSSFETSSSGQYLDKAVAKLSGIGDEAMGLKEEIAETANKLLEAAKGKWDVRMAKLYDSQAAEVKDATAALVRAESRLKEALQSIPRGEYDEFSDHLKSYRTRVNLVLSRLGSLNSALPKDATSVEEFKSNLTAIDGETKQVKKMVKNFVDDLETAFEYARPRIRLVAKLGGAEKNATVTSGIREYGRLTPFDLIEVDVGARINFAVEYTEDGVKYVGEKVHVVKFGSQTVSIEMKPEFTLPYDFKFCGDCGRSLEKHRHVRVCPYCFSYLEK